MSKFSNAALRLTAGASYLSTQAAKKSAQTKAPTPSRSRWWQPAFPQPSKLDAAPSASHPGAETAPGATPLTLPSSPHAWRAQA